MNTQELKSERVRNNMTQREVAEKIGLSEAGYWHKENGKKEFNRQEIERLIDNLTDVIDDLAKLMDKDFRFYLTDAK